MGPSNSLQDESASRLGLVQASGCEEGMLQFPSLEPLELILLDSPNLRRLANREPVELGDMQILDGALPPARIAEQALAQLNAGTSGNWCAPFLIVSGNAVLGSCRFRAAPAEGSVEIGYEVASSQRGRGVARQAVGRLLQIATSSGQVKRVVARIAPENIASSRLVARLGFVRSDTLVDHDGTAVALWSLPIAT